MTTSTNDAEALAAMRKANEVVKGAGLTWNDVITSQNVVNISISRQAPGGAPFGMQREDFQQSEQDWTPPHLTDKVLIEAMFRAIYSQPRSDNEEFWQWVDSVHQQWLDRRRLTPGQYRAIRRCYSRVMKRA